MNKLKSIFGTATENMQVQIDSAKSLWAPTWFPKYFDISPMQQSLTFTTIIGRSRIQAAASVVDRDSKTPLRVRQGLEKLGGEVPAIRVMRSMTERQMRAYREMQQATGITDKEKLKIALDMIWADVAYAGDSCHKRVDIFCLQAISTGKVKIDINTNPDGTVHDDIDLFLSDANRKDAAVTWATSATATPITDIENVVVDAKNRGISFAKILMSFSLWLKFKAAKEVKDTMLTFYYGPKIAASTNPTAVTTLDKINEYLAANKFPIIEIVDEIIAIQKDGVDQNVNFFDQNNASFVPAGKLGTIKQAFAMEKTMQASGVNYADYNNVLISKWSTNEPITEWTKGEWNAFPAVEAIDGIYILKAIL